MKEYLHLFTPITEALPEEKTQGFAYRHDRVLAGQFRFSIVNQIPVIDIGFGHWEEYTHWLDLSKLTTKEKAMDALEALEDDESSISTMPSADWIIRDQARKDFQARL